jgi:hypothetical protein
MKNLRKKLYLYLKRFLIIGKLFFAFNNLQTKGMRFGQTVETNCLAFEMQRYHTTLKYDKK